MRTPARRLYGYLFTLDNEPLAGPVEGDGSGQFRFEIKGSAVDLVRVERDPSAYSLVNLLLMERDERPLLIQVRVNLGNLPVWPPISSDRGDTCWFDVDLIDVLRRRAA